MKSIFMVVMTLLVFSCKQNNEKDLQPLNDKVKAVENFVADSAAASPEPGGNTAEQKNKAGKPIPSPVTDWTQKIIKTANINLELKDYHPFNNSVHNMLAGYGAYIAQEQQQQDEAQITNEISIKVPVDRFETLVNALTADNKNKVLQKQITSADVTAEYADTKAREETKRQVRGKYQEFMNNAHKIDDVLALQSEINSITEDIEAAAGRVKYLNHQSAYSTINLRYFQVLDAAKVDNDNPGFGTKLVQAMKNGTAIIGELLVILMSIWPLLLIGAVAWYFLRRKGILKAKGGNV